MQHPSKSVPFASAVALTAAALLGSCATPAPAPHATPSRWQEPKPSADEPNHAQKPGAATSEDSGALKQANNPIANMKAFSLQDYYIPDVSGTDQSANTFWARYAQPIGGFLMRASLPLSTLPTGMNQSESGIGDANIFAAYLLDSGDPDVSYGIGPLLGLPTATSDALGTDQWSAGAAAVLFDGSSPKLQYGGLVTYQHKFAGSDRAPDVNLLVVQPFGFLQLGDGLYARSAGSWAFNLQTGDYSVPVGVGLGKIVKLEHEVVNLFVEPQLTVLHEGPGQPLFQMFFGMNLQF